MISRTEEKPILQNSCVDLKDAQITQRVIVMDNYFINVRINHSNGKDANVNYVINMQRIITFLLLQVYKDAWIPNVIRDLKQHLSNRPEHVLACVVFHSYFLSVSLQLSLAKLHSQVHIMLALKIIQMDRLMVILHAILKIKMIIYWYIKTP